MGTGFGLVVGMGLTEIQNSVSMFYGYIIQFQITVYNLDISEGATLMFYVSSPEWAGGGGRMKADAFRKFYWGFCLL